MILGGGVAVCLLLSVHRAMIFAIAQPSCSIMGSMAAYGSYSLQFCARANNRAALWCWLCMSCPIVDGRSAPRLDKFSVQEMLQGQSTYAMHHCKGTCHMSVFRQPLFRSLSVSYTGSIRMPCMQSKQKSLAHHIRLRLGFVRS